MNLKYKRLQMYRTPIVRAGAGLYDSVAGVDLEVKDDLVAAVLDVWASLYTARALSSRKAMGLKENKTSMAVLIQVCWIRELSIEQIFMCLLVFRLEMNVFDGFDYQEMVFPKYSFVLHSVNPINKSKDSVYAEIAPGHGETLARGQARGTPWRLSISKTQNASTAGLFAFFSFSFSFSRAFVF